jgi:hypothetical protein
MVFNRADSHKNYNPQFSIMIPKSWFSKLTKTRNNYIIQCEFLKIILKIQSQNYLHKRVVTHEGTTRGSSKTRKSIESQGNTRITKHKGA